ncbi:MAG: SphA family protein [Candidatus Deferrimicrobiaceae bacterium]
MMKRGLVVLLFAVFFAGISGTPALAFDQPLLNFGLTNVLDGAVPGPGTYFFEYVQIYQSGEFKDQDGNDIPGSPRVGFVLSMNQLAHISKTTILGGNIGITFLLPIGSLTAGGTFGPGGPPISANPGPIGDAIVGPFIQWFPHKLLGRPFLHRFELDFIVPTGHYDKKYTINPGANLWTIEPFYAFTWFLTPQLSTSWRIHYTYNTKNDDPWEVLQSLGINEVKPGQAFHFNYSLEYEAVKNLRLAAAGYYLKQLTDTEFNGSNASDRKEQVFAIGPAVHWITKSGLVLALKTAFESSAENRPQGNRTTFRIIYKF